MDESDDPFVKPWFYDSAMSLMMANPGMQFEESVQLVKSKSSSGIRTYDTDVGIRLPLGFNVSDSDSAEHRAPAKGNRNITLPSTSAALNLFLRGHGLTFAQCVELINRQS